MNRRGIVAGWDAEAQRPKGVASAADVRASLTMIADRPGIALEERAAQVTLNATSMGISWTGFNAVIPAPQGGWYTPRIQSGGITLGVGDATYGRVDVVWVRQWDFEHNGSHPDSEVEVGVARGTPSATPQTPAVPDGALAVFTLRVPKGATRGVDIGTAGVTRAAWSMVPQQAPVATGMDVTSRLLLTDTAGWLTAGNWFARLEGKVVSLHMLITGPWQKKAEWEEKNLLSIDPSIAPYHPNRNGTTTIPVLTSNPADGGAYLTAYPNRVTLGVLGSTTWTEHSQTISWIIK